MSLALTLPIVVTPLHWGILDGAALDCQGPL